MKKKNHIALVIKTALDFDGRVISQIDALSKQFKDGQITILLLPDKETTIKFGQNVKIKEVKLFSRFLPKGSFWQFFKMIEYGLAVFLMLLKIKPHMVHVHDESSILGPLMYKKLNKKDLLIYDDHELKNLPPINIQEKLMFALEQEIYKQADLSIVANTSRKRFVQKIFNPTTECNVIENWLYERRTNEAPKNNTVELVSTLKKKKEKRKKILLHQGVLNENRDVKLVQLIAKHLPEDWVMVFIGSTEEQYNQYFSQCSQAYYGGFVYNTDLPQVWKEADSVVIFYSSNTLNNRYCAPNRMYLALNLGIPVISNHNNPELSFFIKKYSNGVCVSEENVQYQISDFIHNYFSIKEKAELLKGKFEFGGTNGHPITTIYEQTELSGRKKLKELIY